MKGSIEVSRVSLGTRKDERDEMQRRASRELIILPQCIYVAADCVLLRFLHIYGLHSVINRFVSLHPRCK